MRIPPYVLAVLVVLAVAVPVAAQEAPPPAEYQDICAGADPVIWPECYGGGGGGAGVGSEQYHCGPNGECTGQCMTEKPDLIGPGSSCAPANGGGYCCWADRCENPLFGRIYCYCSLRGDYCNGTTVTG